MNFLDQLAEEIEAENQRKKAYKKPIGLKGLDSFVDILNDLGNLSEAKVQKPNIEAQRKLKAELASKHADDLKKKFSSDQEGDDESYKRLKQAEIKEKTDKKTEDLARAKKRKKLKNAIIMAEILGKPVSKRR